MRIHKNTSYPTVDTNNPRYSVVVLMFDGKNFSFVRYDFEDKSWYPSTLQSNDSSQVYKFNYAIRKKFTWIYLPVTQMSTAYYKYTHEDNK